LVVFASNSDAYWTKYFGSLAILTKSWASHEMRGGKGRGEYEERKEGGEVTDSK
jgi:hypothetical protein